MQKTRFVRFRVSKDQYERLCCTARVKGFITVSAYLRELSLKTPLYLEEKISNINKNLELISENLPHKKVVPEKIKLPEWFQELKDAGLID